VSDLSADFRGGGNLFASAPGADNPIVTPLRSQSHLLIGAIFGAIEVGLCQLHYVSNVTAASNMHKLQSAQKSLTRVVLPSLRHLSASERLSYIPLTTEYSSKSLHLPIRP